MLVRILGYTHARCHTLHHVLTTTNHDNMLYTHIAKQGLVAMFSFYIFMAGSWSLVVLFCFLTWISHTGFARWGLWPHAAVLFLFLPEWGQKGPQCVFFIGWMLNRWEKTGKLTRTKQVALDAHTHTHWDTAFVIQSCSHTTSCSHNYKTDFYIQRKNKARSACLVFMSESAVNQG